MEEEKILKLRIVRKVKSMDSNTADSIHVGRICPGKLTMLYASFMSFTARASTVNRREAELEHTILCPDCYCFCLSLFVVCCCEDM